MKDFPVVLVADEKGRVREVPGWRAVARIGLDFRPLQPSELIPLPEGAYLMQLPGRNPLGYRSGREIAEVVEGRAVAAFLPPGYLATALAAYRTAKRAPRLPLNTYTAVCWYRGNFHVAALRMDSDPRHHTWKVDRKKLDSAVEECLRKFPSNRLIQHHALNCVRRYFCPNAINFFLGRWEAPAAVSPECNTSCLGCISYQKESGVPAAQQRLDFVPRVEEVVELAAYHLPRARRAMLSFGQGCEGEPLLQSEVIAESLRQIRRMTDRGTLHINTNGSLPDRLEKLVSVGLDSVRLTLPGASEMLCWAYRKGRGPTLDHIRECARIAHSQGVFVSLNLLTFPGVTDAPHEVEALENLLASGWVDMIQWRNLNIDPEWYLDELEKAGYEVSRNPEGLSRLVQKLAQKFPQVSLGCFNPPVKRKK